MKDCIYFSFGSVMMLHAVHVTLKSSHFQSQHQCCHPIRSIAWILTLCMTKFRLRKNFVRICKKKIKKNKKHKHKEDQTKNESDHKFIASRVVTTIHCDQCNKQQCVLSLDSRLSPVGENYLEDVIYSCGMPLDSQNLYTQRMSPIVFQRLKMHSV